MTSGGTNVRYLAVVRGSVGAIPNDYLAAIVNTLKRFSEAGCDLAFTSADASVAGLIFSSDKPLRMISAALDDILNVKDRGFLLLLSLDEFWTAKGNSAGWRHIQRHWKTS